MLNKFICTAVSNDAAVYDGADSIAVFLCKECLAGLPSLHLPELVEKTITKYVAMYEPEQLVQRAWRDAKRGKDVSQYGFVARFQAGLTKLLPHSLVMDVWMRQQKLQ